MPTHGAPPPPPAPSQQQSSDSAPSTEAAELLRRGHNKSVTERTSNNVKLALMRTPVCAALAGAELYQSFLKARGPPPAHAIRAPSRLPSSTSPAIHMGDLLELRPWEARVAAASPAVAAERMARVEARVQEAAEALGFGEPVAPSLLSRIQALLAARPAPSHPAATESTSAADPAAAIEQSST